MLSRHIHVHEFDILLEFSVPKLPTDHRDLSTQPIPVFNYPKPPAYAIIVLIPTQPIRSLPCTTNGTRADSRAGGRAGRRKTHEVVEVLAAPKEGDGAVRRRHRAQRSATLGVTVELGDNHRPDRDGLWRKT